MGSSLDFFVKFYSNRKPLRGAFEPPTSQSVERRAKQPDHTALHLRRPERPRKRKEGRGQSKSFVESQQGQQDELAVSYKMKVYTELHELVFSLNRLHKFFHVTTYKFIHITIF